MKSVKENGIPLLEENDEDQFETAVNLEILFL